MLGSGSLKGLDRRVWILSGGRIISTTGFSIVMPFLAIHLNRDFGTSMSEVGIIYLLMAVAGAFGQIAGGEMSDRLGRRPVMWASMALRGMVFVALFVVMGTVDSVAVIALLLIVSSVLGSLFEPASSAMVADLVEPGRRLEAYSLLRVGSNLGWTLGPLVSGFLIVSLPFSSLFAVAAVTCLSVAVIIYLTVADPGRSGVHHERFHPRDLLSIWHNKLFLVFCLASLPLGIVIGQMSSTFSVFSVQDVGISEAEIGYLYAMNGAIVVLLQFPMARYISRYRMPYVLASGTLMYAVGYFVVGFAGGIWMLVTSMIITTLGENVTSPSSTDMVARMSPENERGRYMGAFGIFSSFGWALGPAFGGVMYDGLHGEPVALWGAVAAIAMISFFGYVHLGRMYQGTGESRLRSHEERVKPLPPNP
ncbi:MAG: MFS transporter [Methanomassiliicoccus sp.]|nr:MFS transporter [Methanomassiliicoccus sp.]